MVKKTQRSAESEGMDESTAGNARFASTVKDSASQIWLAGLGAFAKAQEEGTKVFDALVKEGVAIQRKTQAAAEEKMTEAASRMAGMATELSAKASGRWDKLEAIFEERVSRALRNMGVPSAADMDALAARLDALERAAGRSATGKRAPRAASPAGARAATGAKAAAKKRPARKAA